MKAYRLLLLFSILTMACPNNVYADDATSVEEVEHNAFFPFLVKGYKVANRNLAEAVGQQMPDKLDDSLSKCYATVQLKRLRKADLITLDNFARNNHKDTDDIDRAQRIIESMDNNDSSLREERRFCPEVMSLYDSFIFSGRKKPIR